MSSSQLHMRFIVAGALMAVYISEPVTAHFLPSKGTESGGSGGSGSSSRSGGSGNGNLLSVLLSAGPQLLNAAPQILNAAPQLLNFAPQLLSAAPQLLNAAPQLLNSAPQLLNALQLLNPDYSSSSSSNHLNPLELFRSRFLRALANLSHMAKERR